MKLKTEARGSVMSAGTWFYLLPEREDRTIVDGSVFMVHPPHALNISFGLAEDIEKESQQMVAELRRTEAEYVPFLVERLGQKEETVKEWLSEGMAGKRFSAMEAVSAGWGSLVMGDKEKKRRVRQELFSNSEVKMLKRYGRQVALMARVSH